MDRTRHLWFFAAIRRRCYPRSKQYTCILNMDNTTIAISAAPFRGCCPSVSKSPVLKIAYIGPAHHRKFIAITALTTTLAVRNENSSCLAFEEHCDAACNAYECKQRELYNTYDAYHFTTSLQTLKY